MFSPPRESRTKPHSQCFSPTWRGFHPLGGLPVHLFTGDSPKGPTKRCPAGLGAGSKPRPTSRRTPPPAPGRRTPARSRTSCPVSAASAASAPAAARRTPAARMTTATGVATGVAARVTARVTAAAAARRAAAAPRPPAAARRTATGRTAPALAPDRPLAAAAGARPRRNENQQRHDHEHRDDDHLHGPHVLPSPEASPPLLTGSYVQEGDAPAPVRRKQT